MVPRGLELRTLRLLAVRSNQLSYETWWQIQTRRLGNFAGAFGIVLYLYEVPRGLFCGHRGTEMAVGVLEQGDAREGLPYESGGRGRGVAAPNYLSTAQMSVFNPFTSCAESITVCVCTRLEMVPRGLEPRTLR